MSGFLLRWTRSLSLLAAILVVLTAPGYLWLTHLDPFPTSAVLRCTDVDPFTCHDGAMKAVASLKRLVPAYRHRGMAPIAQIEVRPDVAVLSGDRPRSRVHERADTVYWQVLVTVRYAGGRVSDDVSVWRCFNGHYGLMPYGFAFVLVGPRRAPCA